MKLFVVAPVLGIFILSFQNCSKVGFHSLDLASVASPTANSDACANTPDAAGCKVNVTCRFNGQEFLENDRVKAYLQSSVPSGQTCVSENRVCKGGTFSGSYSYDSCAVGAPAACLFNGQSVADGRSVLAFQNSAVAFGETCESQDRVCSNGTLSGSFNFGTCSVGVAGSCLFNGQTLAHGESVIAYAGSSVPFGLTCQGVTRTCTNGVLSGSASFASCTSGAAASCLFNGQTLAHGGSVKAYQNSSVAFGGACQAQDRLCTNGVLSGSFTYGSCNAGSASSCLFNGQSIAHNQNVKAYQNSTVPFGQNCEAEDRLCINGALNGSYNFGSCSAGVAADCLFNGQTVAHGASVQAYTGSSVPFGQTCQSVTRTCSNGVLSGSASYANCAAGVAASCLFSGQSIAHGETLRAFQNSSVVFGGTCQSQDRVCTNGALSGSFDYASCNVGAPVSCLFNGQSLAHNQIVKAYQSSTVPFGQTCESQDRLCVNGALNGSYNFGSCSVGVAAACLFNGQTVAHGASVQAYTGSSVPFGQTCQSATRTCSNGVLSGSATYASCTAGTAASCLLNGQTIAHGSSTVAFQSSWVGYGQSCQSQQRTCNNGSLNGSYSNSSCAVQPGASCTLDGVTVAHGASRNFYSSSTVECEGTCASVVRTCSNGVFSGSTSYSRASCSVNVCAQKFCSPNTTRSCSTFPNASFHPGTGSQTCDAQGSAWGACVRLTCSAQSGITEGNCTGSVPTSNAGASLGDISSRFSNSAHVWDVRCDQDGWKWQFTCPAQKNQCQGIRQTMKSLDGSNSCTFYAPGAYDGDKITVTDEGGNGGTGTATCSANGWAWLASCPSKVSAVKTCPAGELNDLGGSGKRYYFGWGQATAGTVKKIYATNDSKAFATISCSSAGVWSIDSATLP